MHLLSLPPLPLSWWLPISSCFIGSCIQVLGISWATSPKSSPCVSLGNVRLPLPHGNPLSFICRASSWLHSFLLRPGFIQLCSPLLRRTICHRGCHSPVKFLIFPSACWLSKRVHSFQTWRFSDTTLLLPKMETSEVFAEKIHILLQPKTNSSLLNIYRMLSAVMPSRNLWCSWWNETDTCETIWEQQKHNKCCQHYCFGAEICVTIVAPRTLEVDADIHRAHAHLV